jgi:diadenosine tetraphosphate (Ap4A) HIT family hydrolase
MTCFARSPGTAHRWFLRLALSAAAVSGNAFTIALFESGMLMNFGPFPVHEAEIVFKSALSYVMVNLNPIIEGHLLALPQRRAQYLRDLTLDERIDLFRTADIVAHAMKRLLAVPALEVTCQDGPIAGQTVPHVHLHILPRKIPTDWTSGVRRQAFEIRAELAQKYAAAVRDYLAGATD